MVTKIKDIKYERVDIAKMVEATKKATAAVKNAASAEEIVSIRDGLNRQSRKVSTMCTLVYWRHTLDVNDKFYTAEQDYYDENLPALWAEGAEFGRAVVESKHAAELEKLLNPLILQNIRASVRVMDSRIVDDRVEENRLVTEYDKLMATLSFPWEGKGVPISTMFRYCKDKDRAVRKKAFETIGKTLESVSDKLDELYDKLVKVRDRMAKKMGFKSFVEMGDLRIGHVAYGRKEIGVFRNSVLRDVVPTLARLKKSLADSLGIDHVHLYDNDNYVAGGNIDPEGDAEKLVAAAQKMYDDMHPALGSFFNQLCEAEAIDYVARDGKSPGGYCDILTDFGQPIIFANFNGTMDDVGVLTHEFGHAYAFKRAHDNDVDDDLGVGGMETAETHSMSMEALCNKYNDLFYGKRADDATYQQIFDAFNFLAYGVIVDYFQELVYDKPDMTPSERKALWIKLEGQFRPYVDMSDIPYISIGGRWQYQKHIYEVPFYYIDYCLSTCLALQFGELAAKDHGEALSRYMTFVEAGGTKTIDTLAHEAGFFSPFDDGALKKLCADVEAHLKALE
ncbi:MAG: M3 family oligoendopeptidase [Clostridiales bacterium]|nr:M3 family oligoendopeptidase [Clostridiales bacterium]